MQGTVFGAAHGTVVSFFSSLQMTYPLVNLPYSTNCHSLGREREIPAVVNKPLLGCLDRPCGAVTPFSEFELGVEIPAKATA